MEVPFSSFPGCEKVVLVANFLIAVRGSAWIHEAFQSEAVAKNTLLAPLNLPVLDSGLEAAHLFSIELPWAFRHPARLN